MSILLEAEHLTKTFTQRGKNPFKAVNDVSFTLKKGETLGIVGESGCGKTTCGKTVMGLYKATGGEVLFDGVDINKLNKNEKKEFTKRAQIIFQDPYSSLNPRMTVGDIIGEGIDIHKLYTGKERQEKIYELLELVGLNREHALRFPHEFSGGQRQRIGIARALAIEPEFIVCDEPISALDVSIQAQVVNLLIELQQKKNLTYLFIAHDLSMVKHISDRVGVMYLGNMVEFADPDTEEQKKRIRLEGEIPSPVNPKPGCRFVTRCRYATEKCHQETPQLEELKPEHFVACHRAKELMEDHPQE